MRIFLQHRVADRLDEVCFTQSDAAIDKQRIVASWLRSATALAA